MTKVCVSRDTSITPKVLRLVTFADIIVRNLTFSEPLGGLWYVIIYHFLKAKVLFIGMVDLECRGGSHSYWFPKLINSLLQIWCAFTSLTFSQSPFPVPICQCWGPRLLASHSSHSRYITLLHPGTTSSMCLLITQTKIIHPDLTPEIQKHARNCFLGHWISHWHLDSIYPKSKL